MITTKNTVLILIDFDNTFKRPISEYTAEILEQELSSILNNCFGFFQDVESFIVRLYGGWYKNNLLTTKASELQQHLYNINLFPILKDNVLITGKIELASTLITLPDYIWGHTYKEKNGIARMRIESEKLTEHCSENKDKCPLYIISKFTKSKEKLCSVNDCGAIQKDVIKGVEQKMVDTILACDIIHLSEVENVIGISLFSEDFDHLPAIASSAMKSKVRGVKTAIFVRNEENVDLLNQIMSRFEVKIVKYD